MKICHLSTFWPNRFGHTHYTNELIRGMQAHESERHWVLAEHPSADTETDSYTCVPCFRREQDYVESILVEARNLRPDVMIVQYSNDLFGDDNRFSRLLEALRGEGILPVVNTHSIYPEHWKTSFRPERTAAAFDQAMARHAAMVQVHSPRMRMDLIARGVDEAKIAVIPHGSKPMEARDPLECRENLGIPKDARVVLFFGFIWLGKGLDFLLDVFKDVQRQVPDAYLLVAGHTRQSIAGIYVKYLKARTVMMGYSKRSRFWGGYVDDSMVPTIYSAADVVAMPYCQDYSSVSGVVHQTAGIGKLMLCSRTAKFDEVESIDSQLTLPYGDRAGWTKGLVRLLKDEDFKQAMREKIIRFGMETSWNNVGRTHVDLCRRLTANQKQS